MAKLGSTYQYLLRRLSNDNHYNVIFLSTAIIIVPCSIYFVNKLIGHFDQLVNIVSLGYLVN